MSIQGQLPPQIAASTGTRPDLAGLRPGQSVTVRVVGPAPGGGTRLAISAGQPAASNSRIDVQLAQSPPAGTVAQLRLEGTGPAARLVLFGLTTPPQAGATPSIAATASPAADAVAQVVLSALGRQDSAGPLLTNLQQLTRANTPLPEPVANAARQILASRLDLSPPQLSGPALASAIARSGIFFEASLANSAATGAPISALQGDFKGLLLLLRSVLSGGLGGAPTRPGGTGRPPPPTRGAPARAAANQSATKMTPGALPAPELGIQALMAQTRAALARLRLAQIASLPEAGATKPAKTSDQATAKLEWTVEIPVVLGQQSTMVNMRITRDGGSARPERQREWRIQFALEVENLGEVGGQVGARAGVISVELWAQEQSTRRWLRDRLSELTSALEACGLRPGAIRCRPGPPADPARGAGQFVDARS